MPSRELHTKLIVLELALAVITFVALFFIVAPYGRHERPGFGPRIAARAGWVIMESPALVLFLIFYSQGKARLEVAPLALAALWILHYGHRVLVFPFRMQSAGKKMPLSIVGLAIAFNVLNASVNAPQLAEYGRYDADWIGSCRFLFGALLFIAGFWQNLRADEVLFRLRRDGKPGYRIPTGALHDWVACPNYLGEIVEWTGFAIATWSLAGLSFALYTAANLVPRAIANLTWYRRTFPDYPKNRRAVFPWLL